MSWPAHLKHLQEIDQELSGVTRQLGEITAQLGNRTALDHAATQVQATTAAVAAAVRAQKDLEFELGRLETKRKTAEQRLYSGKVTNPRELGDLQTEIQSLQRRKAQMEDQILEAMVQRESAEADSQNAQAAHAQAQSSYDALHQTLSAEQTHLLERQQELQNERQSLRTRLPANILEAYDYLGKRIGGIVVAQVRGDTCGVCGMEISKPTQHKARSGEETYCENCRRLLVM